MIVEAKQNQTKNCVDCNDPCLQIDIHTKMCCLCRGLSNNDSCELHKIE